MTEQSTDARRRLTISTAFLVLANLIPVVGVLLWDWDVLYLLLIFWCENVIIGLYGILRMLFAGNGIFLSAFFMVHYGGFMFGHLMILFSIFADGRPELADLSELEILNEVIFRQVTLLPIIGLLISHGWSFVNNFLLSGEKENIDSNEAMALPYKRMVVTHIALIAGGVLLSKLGEPVAGLLLLAGMKIALDVVLHRREHESLQSNI